MRNHKKSFYGVYFIVQWTSLWKKWWTSLWKKMEYVYVTGFLFVVSQRTGGNSMANVLLMEPIAL